MSKYCTKCGTQLPDDAVFCSKCGSRQTEINTVSQAAPQNAARTQTTQNAAKQQAAQYTAKQQAAPRKNYKTVPQTSQKKKKGGCLTRFIALLLVAAIVYTGFFNPGFFKGKTPKNIINDVKNTVSNIIDPKNSGKNVPVYTEVLGNSKAISSSPCEGVFVSAEKDAFWQDTEIKMEPITKADETLLKTVAELEEEGYMAIAGYEVDAGLADDEVIPGVYTVSIDLSTLGISEDMYEYLCVYRVADDGTYYEYASWIEDGKLVYNSDQNSISLITVAECIVLGYLIKILVQESYPKLKKMYDQEFVDSTKYFLKPGVEKSEITRKSQGVKYTLRWSMKDIGVDVDADLKKMDALAEKYKSKANELYKQYEEDKLFNSTNILNIFSRNKSVEEVIYEAIKNDPEYQKLEKEIKMPEIIEYTIGCIDTSFKYLKEEENIKMPTGTVEITSMPGLPSGTLGLAMSRKTKVPWVHIDLAKIVKGGQKDKDTLLVTLTHELLHVCQKGYRYWWTDSVRFDELVAVVVERRAAEWYKMEGIIDYDSGMDMCPVDFWGTLKLPIDKYYVAEEDASIMMNEGYNLGLFSIYLTEKTGKIMWGGRLMRTVSSIKEGGVSASLMKAFGLNEAEFETYYKLWARTNKNKFSAYYIGGEASYNPNDPITIEKGKKYSVQVVPEGSYISEIRAFKQKTQDPMTLLLIPDVGFSTDLPGTQLVPIDSFTQFSKGLYLPALKSEDIKASRLYRNILEITGVLNRVGDQNGYAVYVLDKTKPASCSENEDDLVMKFPDLSDPANAKIIDGYLLTILTPGGGKIEKEIGNSYFKNEYKLSKEEFFKDTDDEEIKLNFTLCEYVLTGDNTKLFGEVSDEFSFTIHKNLVNDLSKFTDMWIPVEIPADKIKPEDWCLGLIYLPEDNEFGEYEWTVSGWETAKSRWIEIKYFDYDSKTGVLTIDFEKNAPDKAVGTATFRINEAGRLEMTNSGGTFEFYRAPKD